MKSQMTSGSIYLDGSPISYTSCSETVAKLTTPPVPGGLVTTNDPLESHSAIGKPILCLKIYHKKYLQLRFNINFHLKLYI